MVTNVDTIHQLWMGFGIAVSPINLLYCLIGATVGTLVGVLPGIGPLTTIAMLLPITFKLPALPALIMLSGIYYGAHHAGSTTAIMLNMPGEPTSVVICIDGHPMARQGRAGPALCISAIGSFIAGCISILVIAFCSPLLARVALSFGPPEYCAVVIMALIAASVLSNGPVLLTIAMTVLGVLLGTVGSDMISGERRFDFGSPDLADGINFVALAVALFAFADILSRAGQPDQTRRFDKIRGLLPTRADLAASWKPILRGTALGAAFGVLPGTGPLVSSFASYSLEKRLAADPSRFGNGAIEGVAGPESANNAAAFTHFIPMLTLGIPAGAAMALMLGALMIQGITPGPQVMTDHPDLFWGVIASMWLGNGMLLILNLPLIGVWIRLLRVRYRILYPAILVFCCIGVYSVNNSTFDVLLAVGMGLVGYLFAMLDCPPAPVILGFILGPILEVNLRRTLLISQGDFTVFVTRPISLGFLLLALALLGAITLPALRRR
jgi:putative tricarboxylic transport membrane protein